MTLPSYYLNRPEADWSKPVTDAFDDLYEREVRNGDGSFIDYALSAPKWQFLCYLADSHGVLVHGSGSPDIAEFEPRQSNDSLEFGNQKAVYAASDGLWAMYFAIVDRDVHVRSLVNSCVQVAGKDPAIGRGYYFSINADALPHTPWRAGSTYILPCEGFEPQKSDSPGQDVLQWRNFNPVKPLAKLAVEPSDFPFLDRVRGHDPKVVNERARANPDGFPWLDE